MKPLDELELPLFKFGSPSTYVQALHESWVEQRTLMDYKPLPCLSDGSYPSGVKEDWLARMDIIKTDLQWFLQLPYHRFWSQIVYQADCMDMINSFLVDAPPFYIVDEFRHDKEIWDIYFEIYKLVFCVLKRLGTHYESENNFMSPELLGDLLYKNYIMTIPTLLDMCLLYGRDCQSDVADIISTIFTIQPAYFDDLQATVAFIIKTLKFVEWKFGNSTDVVQHGDVIKLSSVINRGALDVAQFRDLVIHVLDTAATLSIFLGISQPACEVFHHQLFELRLVKFYENTIPEMYMQLEKLVNKEDTQPLYVDLKHKLDITRVEFLNTFRHILGHCLNCSIEDKPSLSEMERKKRVEDYMSVLTECLSEKVFMRDYHKYFPVDVDLELLSMVSQEVNDKRGYLMEAVLSNFDPPKKKLFLSKQNETQPASEEPSCSTVNGKIDGITGVQLDSLITEVQDILPHLGEGFIQKCLEYYNYSSESVIHALLESSLASSLADLDQSLPRIPLEAESKLDLLNSAERSNVFDNDEFDIMTRDYVDTTRIHKGKRVGKHKDLASMLNDKTHVTELGEKFKQLGLVDVYEDEYDDTYDHVDISVDEACEPERMLDVLFITNPVDGQRPDDSGPVSHSLLNEAGPCEQGAGSTISIIIHIFLSLLEFQVPPGSSLAFLS
uniref:CUE domain-containing protein n=1 Tax=Timema genevievae TaxID=629358 RepID=A0A7R9K6B7_TIMGE|nr:unnamed protein product [Timema genevievae]